MSSVNARAIARLAETVDRSDAVLSDMARN
jgi:hypothetical protein